MTVLPTRARRAVLTAQGLALGGAMTLAAVFGASAAQEAACAPMAGPMESAMQAAAAGTPVADLVGTPAAEDVTAAATAVVENFVACWNSGDLGGTLSLVTPNLLQTKFGVADAQAAEAALPELDLGPITPLEIGAVNTYDDGRVSIDVGYQVGDFAHVDGRWFLVEGEGGWLIDQEHLLPPDVEGDKAFVSFSIADDASPVAFDQRSDIAPIPVLVLHGINNGEERHVFHVVDLPDMEGTPMPGDLPEGGKVIGLLSIAPGDQEDLALVGLAEGVYAVVDPAVEGSVATISVATPAE